MPRVPTVSGPSVTPAGIPDAYERAPSALGETTRIAGQQWGQVAGFAGAWADVIQREHDENDRARVDDALNSLRQRQNDLTYASDGGLLTFRGRDALERPNGVPLGAEFTAKLRDYASELTNGLSGERQKQVFQAKAKDALEAFRGQALRYELEQSQAYKRDVQAAQQVGFLEDLSRDATAVAGDDARYADTLANQLRIVQRLGGDPDKQAKMVADARATLAVSATRGLVERNPTAALVELDAYFSKEGAQAPFVAALTPAQAAALRSEARTETQRAVAGARTEMGARARDLQAMVMAGVSPPADQVPTQEEAIKVFGPDGARWYRQEVQTYVQVGDAIGKMRAASPEERRAIVTATTPQPGEGFAEQQRVHQAMLQAEALIEKRLRDDPATYAMEASPRVQRAQAAMAKVLQTNPADTAAVVDFYARVQDAEQRRLGVASPKFLTDGQAAAVVQQFNDQAAGGRGAAKLVSDLESTWGRWWPQVYSQLAAAKLPPAALVIPNMKDAGARTRLAEWSAMKPADRDNLIAPADKATLTDKVLEQFSGAAASFMAQGGGGQRTIATVVEQANILAMGYRSQGKSIGDAAKQAYDEVMGWKYEFTPTYRVPKEEQAELVQRGAEAALLALVNVKNLAPPTVPGGDGMTLDAIATNATWVVNRDETGLRLTVRGQDGALYQVLDGSGKPIDMTWSRLRSEALTQQTVDALSTSHRLSAPKSKAGGR
jgi:hypothetical protein